MLRKLLAPNYDEKRRFVTAAALLLVAGRSYPVKALKLKGAM